MDTSHLKERAVAALRQRRWEDARVRAVQLLSHEPADPELHFIAGIALLEQQKARNAQHYLTQAIALDPKRADFYLYLARAHAAVQDYARALDAASNAYGLLAADDAEGLDTLGVVLVQCHAYERAADAFRRAVSADPHNAAFRFNLGTALTFLGDIDDAERELEAAIRIQPHHWRAHHSLSQLRRQTPESNHVQRLSLLAQQTAGKVTATTFLNMALSKELEDLGDYEGAFDRCVAGKSAPREMLRYSRRKESDLFASLASCFPDPFSSLTTSGSDADDPIFIVGMPRTGTTLVDRIVSSHPQVHSAGELHNFPSAWKRELGGQSFDMFDPAQIANARTRNIDWRKLGDDYVASTRAFTGERPFFTDKLPHNFLYLGYIACALPAAKIICVRRHPLDTCLSNFRQLFAPESPYFDYSYDLLDTGHYYILFERLMSHWRTAFPERVLEVQYESLVTEQERISRALLAHCGLEWDDACIAFEKNSAPVTTASAVQVRAPIYRTSIGRWKRYEERLAPLREMLETAGIDCS